MVEDHQIVHSLRHRRPEAMGAMVDTYGPFLLGMLKEYALSADDREHIIQQVFLEAWRRAGEIQEGEGALLLWLGRQTMLKLEERGAGQAASSTTPYPLSKQVLQLVLFRGLPLDRIASLLNLSPDEVRRNLKFGMMAIRNGTH